MRERDPVSAAAAGALLALTCALLYGMTLSAPVAYDDLGHVVGNPAWELPLKELMSALVSRDYFAIVSERTYQPLVTLFHFLTHEHAAVFRAAGILLHFVNSLLVLRLGSRLGLDSRAALLAAALFCCHPAATEAVNFSSFKGHLFGFAFGVAALEAWLLYLERGRAWSLGLAAGLYAGALLSKETGLAAGLLAALAWLLLSRRRERAWGLAVLGGLSLAYLTWRFAWLRPPAAFSETFEHSTWLSLSWYLRALAWPWPLCLEHSAPRAAAVWPALPAFAALLAALRARSKDLWLALWLPAALVPFLHLLPFANLSPVADRYLYLSAAGFCLLAARMTPARARAVLVALCLAWGATTALRNGLYRDARALAEHTAACAPGNARAQYALGLLHFGEGRPAEAEAALRRAFAARESPGVATLIGESLFAQGKLEEAASYYRWARRLDGRWSANYPGAALRLRQIEAGGGK